MNGDFALIDTHAHLYAREFDADREVMLDAARKAGIREIYLPNVDSNTVGPMLETVRLSDELCHPMIGLHPCSVKEDYRLELSRIESWLDQYPFVAIGEIGTDLFWDKTFIEAQVECLEIQIGWAKERNLPVVLHSRDSLDMTLDIIDKHQDGMFRGVFHCFTGTREQAERAVSLGFFLGIGGVVTFKNSGLPDVLRNVSPEWIVLETDAPYLAPVPYRGKRNESAYIRLVADKLADIFGIPVSEIAAATTANARRLFAR